jgi:hypothetical protein
MPEAHIHDEYDGGIRLFSIGTISTMGSLLWGNCNERSMKPNKLHYFVLGAETVFWN